MATTAGHADNDTESSSHHDPPQSPESDSLPPLAAAFLIRFDLKVGYTLAWKRAAPNVHLEGVVEYKSLPSGLHNVKEDLVYFVHEEYAGLSAFVQRPATQAERNAHFVSVGILVPLSYGRLGRSWLHAPKLKELAMQLVDDTTRTEPLEKFWTQHQLDPNNTNGALDSSFPSPTLSRPPPAVLSGPKRRSRALSNVTAVLSQSAQTLPSYHPALSILQYIDTFGPLIFPLHRAALLRKRILLTTPPPVRLACEFVYDLSILSTIPSHSSDVIPPDSEVLSRLKPLFALGIHDIPFLEKEAQLVNGNDTPPTEEAIEEERSSIGWVACSTDEILSMKSKLYDLVIELSPSYSRPKHQKVWPVMKDAAGKPVKATQRDLRRYRALKRALGPLRTTSNGETQTYSDEVEDERTHLLFKEEDVDADSGNNQEEKLVEPMTWAALAYQGFMWWASAGERDALLEEESDQDRVLLGELTDVAEASSYRYRDEPQEEENEETAAGRRGSSGGELAAVHTAVIAYFHRLTNAMFQVISDIVEQSDERDAEGPRGEDEDDDDDDGAVVLDGDDLRRMGLDDWSEADRPFVEELVALYWAREARIRGAGVECCGVRIC